jgi:hypothetical protein
MRGAGPDLSAGVPDEVCNFMRTFIGSIGSVAPTRRVHIPPSSKTGRSFIEVLATIG